MRVEVENIHNRIVNLTWPPAMPSEMYGRGFFEPIAEVDDTDWRLIKRMHFIDQPYRITRRVKDFGYQWKAPAHHDTVMPMLEIVRCGCDWSEVAVKPKWQPEKPLMCGKCGGVINAKEFLDAVY